MNKDGRINIKIFNVLDAIRDKNDITADTWASASDLQPVRISELRNFANGKGGRALSIKTLQRLIGGLYMVMGQATTKTEIARSLERLKSDPDVPTEDLNHVILILLGHETNKEITPILEAFLHKQ